MIASLIAGLLLVVVPSFSANFITPTKKAETRPELSDDLNFEQLDLALERQIAFFKRSNLNGTIRLGKTNYPLRKMLDSVTLFRAISGKAKSCLKLAQLGTVRKDQCFSDFQEAVYQQFDFYTPDFTPDDPEATRPLPALYTAYYSPDINVMKKATAEFKYAIYALPGSENLRTLTRKEIDFQGKLKGRNLELFYTDDLFAVYLMHIEGGGRVNILNPQNRQVTERFYLSYAGHNSRPMKFISAYMLAQGMITTPTIEAQRVYLKANPDKLEEIFSTCPSYIYFKITNEPPHGVGNIPLTDNRSLAMDMKYYEQKGLITFVISKRPRRESGQTVERPFARFYLDQDTGGAIKGKARADLYFGFGPEAEMTANQLKNFGEMYFLIKK